MSWAAWQVCEKIAPTNGHREQMIEKVVSGGQTGVDQAALRAAKAAGIATGGWVPKGFRTVTGPAPELAEEFGSRECHSEEYRVRTELNVRDSDATLMIAANWSSRGMQATIAFAQKHRKPTFRVDMSESCEPEAVITWLRETKIRVLNVAGNREPTSKGAKAFGIGAFAEEFLARVFELESDKGH